MKTLLKLTLAASCGLMVLTSAQATVTISPAAGFNITWDGNDGVHFDPAAPPGGAVVPDNLALASNGATPISSSDLGPELGIAFHIAANLNDGLYGNANSWISASADPGGAPGEAGVLLAGGQLFNVTSVAWGRDNGNGEFDDSAPGSDCCGGQLDDRWAGLYTLQGTADGGSNWFDIGTLDYVSSEDIAPGGDFTGYLRHEYGVATDGGGPVTVNGVRLLVPTIGLGGGTAIDEIEVYGAVVPEPSTSLLLLLGALGFLRRRR